jgi:hypothetical protein
VVRVPQECKSPRQAPNPSQHYPAGDIVGPRQRDEAVELDEANKWVIREAIRRLGSQARLDPVELRKQLANAVREHGEESFAKLSEQGRVRLLKEGRTLQAQEARLRRIDEAIQYGRWLIDRYQVETLGELPQGEQLEFTRLWANAIGGARPYEN